MRVPGRKLGTFGGVFTPSLLTILGIILFLRLGFVVGSAGLPRAFAILALGTAVSLLTSVSLAAIATNRKVRGGGDYYLISRSLGIEYGGALGLVLFLAQSVSIAFYCSGFGEGAAAAFGLGPEHARALGLAAAALVLTVALLGADVATRVQYGIMAVLGLALASFFLGGSALFDPARLAAAASARPDVAFWPLFALFFPAVTGFTQGVSMSGDLADPAKSLPRGTFLAVACSTVVYAAAMAVFAGALPLETLRSDYTAMRQVASHALLIDAGVMAATLSSALASALGGPRILQALAADGVFRTLTPFARTSDAGNPRRAIAVSGAIALAALAAGGLDAIAALVSMFFLISYALLNYATYVEATGASPSFRPRFRFFDARASLLGTLLCVGCMLAIAPWEGLLALALLAAVHRYLRLTAIPSRWRDSRYAYRFRRVKDGLREIAAAAGGSSDWQPHVLVFTGGHERRERLLRFAAWITGGSGLVTAVQILEGEPTLEGVRRQRAEEEDLLRAEIERMGVEAYPLVVAERDARLAGTAVVQSWGIGPIRSNTVLLNWIDAPDDDADPPAAALRYARLLRDALRLGQNAVVFEAESAAFERIEATEPSSRRIDVWWLEDDSSRLALLFAYLATRTETWDEASIRVLVPTAAGAETKRVANLTRRFEERRIAAEIVPVVADDAAPLIACSRESTLVLLPFRLDGLRIADPLGGSPQALFAELPVVGLVGAAGSVRLQEAEPEPAPAAAATERPEGDAPSA